jgi:hypothetical protein
VDPNTKTGVTTTTLGGEEEEEERGRTGGGVADSAKALVGGSRLAGLTLNMGVQQPRTS